MSGSGESESQARRIHVVVEPFAAVVTTGIYCQPECGARPLPAHVRRFPLAAAAEAAGYRACLRCRPYRMPPSLVWTAPELVCRGVSLILDGVLDEGTEAQLARRLGVSGRHLRRLFMTHLGVTPDGLARSARAHFARRLLDDTDLTITEIAFAAGFGSLRQFNRACQDIFRASPRTLRAKRRKSDRLVADGGLLLRLPFRGALDWEALTSYFASRAIPGVEFVSGRTYRRTIIVGADHGVIELAPGGPDHLMLRAHLPHWEELIHVVERVRRIASLDLDLDEPIRHLRDDPVIGPMLRARPGLRPPGAWDPFETGVRSIIEQEVSVAAANAIIGRLVERIGSPAPGLRSLGLTHTFPSPEIVGSTHLTDIGVTTATERAVRMFARGVATGAIRLDRSVSLEHLVASVTAIEGVDPQTAQYLALRLGEPDAYPATDLGPRQAASRPAPERAPSGVERWRPWRALAAMHVLTNARLQRARAERPGAA